MLIFDSMNENLDPTDSNFNSEEIELDKALRPLSFDDFAGQNQILDNLRVFVEACNQRSDALDHTLFHGPPGLGKTTLAHIVAKHAGYNPFEINASDDRSTSILTQKIKDAMEMQTMFGENKSSPK